MQSTDITTSALILTLPIGPVMNLHLPTCKKISVMGMFLLGGFTLFSGIFRIVYLNGATQHLGKHVACKPSPVPSCPWLPLRFFFINDELPLTRQDQQAPGLYWALIQAGIGVVSACLPCLGPIFAAVGIQSMVQGSRRSDSNAVIWKKRPQRDAESMANLAREEPNTRGLASKEQDMAVAMNDYGARNLSFLASPT